MININSALSSLNSNYSFVTDVVPDLFYFSDEPEVSELGINYSSSIAIQDDGKLILGGALGTDQRGAWTNSFFNVIEPGVIRINANGTLDETFVAPIFSQFSNVTSVTIQPADGKIVVGGYFSVEYDSKTYENIIRLNTDGSVDGTFNSGFTSLFNDTINKVIAVNDGIIVYGNDNNEYNGVVVDAVTKLNTDGTLNTEFNDNFVALSGSFNFNDFSDIEVLSNGKILVPYFIGNDGHVLKINANGTQDETWTTNLVFTNNYFNSLYEDANNNIFCAGEGAATDGINNYYNLVKLNSNGTVDDTFIYPENLFFDPNYIVSIETQPDGKVLIGGWFYSYGNQYRRYIQRLNSDGSLDETFSSPYSFDGVVLDIKYLGQNEIWVAGIFSKPYKGIVKLDHYGQPLTTGLPVPNDSFGIKDGGNDLYDYGSFFNTDAHDYQGMGPVPYDLLKEGGIFEQPPFGGEGGGGYDFYAIPSTHTQSSIFYPSNYDFTSTYGWAYKPDVLDSSVRLGAAYFGGTSVYFTQMYPGMFVLVATNININEFSITGGTGVSSDYPVTYGSVSTDVFSISSNGQTYTCFLKSVYGRQTVNPYDDPSINHIIIVPGSADGITHLYDETSQWDDHCLQGLTGRKEIYYLMLSRGNNLPLSSQDAQFAAQRFMDTIGTTVTTYCPPSTCNTAGSPCIFNNVCVCAKKRLFAPNCSLSQSNSGICSSVNGAYVPAITVCRQRLF
jgi:uncharacterized delta-60 repeat protein